jgi:ankyrin repeat protein
MIALVKLLVTDGVSPNVLDEKAETPLAKAISMNFKTIAGYLLKHGACPQLGDKKSALHYAVVNKDKYSIAMTKLMLSVLKNSNQKESFLESLFYTALKANNKTVCELLMKKFSVDPLLPKIQLSIEENSVLELVVEHQFNLILEALMTKGVDLNCINEQGESLLVQALRKKNKKTVSLLLKNGASPTFGGPRSALNYSIARKDLFDTTKNMLQHILSTSDAGKNLCLESALYTAIKETNMQVVDFLLAHDVNPFLPSLPRYQWEDSCVLAILSQDLILLQKISHYNGVRLPFTFSVDGYTPLNFAIRLKNASMVKFFLERDSAINEVNDSNQFSPLYQAVESGDEKIFSLLMTAGANPYQRNYYGTSSPFHLLIQFNQISLLKILLKHSENVDYQHEDRQLALSLLTHNSLAHQVARYGSIEMIGLLSFYGFSFLQKNKLNKTPLDLGKKRGDSLVIKALQDAVLKEEDLNETELLKEDIAAEYELIQKLTSLSFLGFSKSNPSKPVSPAASTKTQRNNL